MEIFPSGIFYLNRHSESPEIRCGDMKSINSKSSHGNQIVGNIGLYYVCYQLSMRGWNVMPTARNARGVDVLIYNQNATKTRSIQVKALSSRSTVPLGKNRSNLIGNFLIVYRLDTKKCYVLTPKEAADKAFEDSNGSLWLKPKEYEQFEEAWRRIGSGSENQKS
jgi:hypothetical protein